MSETKTTNDPDVLMIRREMEKNLDEGTLERINAALDRLAVKALHPLIGSEAYKRGYDDAKRRI